jgi:hypothetical protein
MHPWIRPHHSVGPTRRAASHAPLATGTPERQPVGNPPLDWPHQLMGPVRQSARHAPLESPMQQALKARLTALYPSTGPYQSAGPLYIL